jgi:hypothetical protein
MATEQEIAAPQFADYLLQCSRRLDRMNSN